MARGVAVLLTALVVAGCGDEEGSAAGDGQSTTPARDAEETALAYVTALSAADYAGACDLLTTDLRDQFEQVSGSCERGLNEEGPVGDTVKFDSPEIASADESATSATVQVEDADGDSATVRLENDADVWRVARTLHDLRLAGD